MEPLILEILQWVLLALLLPGLIWIAQMLTKVRVTQGTIVNSLVEMQKWHAPQMIKANETLIDEIRDLRGDFKDVIPKLQEEHRIQDRAMEAMTKIVTDIASTLQRDREK